MSPEGTCVHRMKKTAIVYWLLPAKPKRELFCHFVRIFCRELRAPNFDPHLTLFARSKGRQGPAKVLRQVRSRPIRLSVRNVAFSGKFTKTLYVRFKSTPALKKLAVDIARATNSRAKALRDPHVSLLYTRIPRAARRPSNKSKPASRQAANAASFAPTGIKVTPNRSAAWSLTKTKFH